MDHQSGKSSSVCFICLKVFDSGCSPLETEKDTNFSQHKNNYTHALFISETLKNFLQLLTNYLEIPTNQCHYFDNLSTRTNRKEDVCCFQVFCESCIQKVNGLHEIYLELLSVELKLSLRLEELGELMLIKEEETAEIVSQEGLLKSLSIQLGIEESSRNCVDVEELRKTIVFKCQSKRDSRSSERVRLQDRLDEEIDVKEELESHDEDDEDGFDAIDTDFFDSCNKSAVLPNKRYSKAGGHVKNVETKTQVESSDEDEVEEEEKMDDDDLSEQSISRSNSESDSMWSPSSSSTKRKLSVKTPRSQIKFRKTTPRKTKRLRKNHSPPKDRNTTSKPQYTCEICNNQPFPSIKQLMTHASSKHKHQKSIKCCFCFRSFSLSALYQHHLQAYHTTITKTFPCDDPKCSQIFSTHLLLNNHLKLDHPHEEIHHCPQCHWGFLKPYHLTLHKLLHTPRKKNTLYCPNCPTHYGFICQLQDHFNIKHGENEKIRKCPFPNCDVKCTTLASVNRHMKSHSEKEDPLRPHSCPDCGKKCKNEGKLKFHRTWYHTEIPCPYYNKCRLKFRRKLLLIKHIKEEHKDSLDSQLQSSSFTSVIIPCEVCGKPIKMSEKDLTRMQSHLETHLSPEERQNCICDLCGFGFGSEVTLNDHIAKIHKEPSQKPNETTDSSSKIGSGRKRIFMCELCPKIVTTHLGLKRHMKVVHENPKLEVVFKCNFESCSQSFRMKEELQAHVGRDHVPPSPQHFMCNLCGRVFATLQRLQRHGIFHSGEKNHKCSVCGKGFTQRWTLNDHMKTRHPPPPPANEVDGSGGSLNVEEFQFKCEQPGCKAKFRVETYLRRHMRTKHKIYSRT